MHILINTWVTQCSARHTESAGWTDRRAARAEGGGDSRGAQGREMVEDMHGGPEE